MTMNKETDDLSKKAVLKFLGDDPNVRQQFFLDLTFPQPPAPAPQIMFEILPVLRDISHLFYGIIASLFATYLYHHITHKRQTKKLKEELETQIHKILQDHQGQIVGLLKQNEELRSRFKKVNLKRIFIRVPPNFKAKWEIHLEVYSDRAKLLLKPDEATEIIIKIFDDITYADWH